MSCFRGVFCLFLITAAAWGCRTEPTPEPTPPTRPEPEVITLAPPDTTGRAVWAHLQDVDYRSNWTLWPGKGEFYEGREPHGALLTTYLNEDALGAVSAHAGAMPDGALIVKENYRPDATLAAITVMYKVVGYNPDHADWFFAKYQPDGTIATGPNGMALEGRVPSCEGCHSERADNDYIQTAPLGG